MKNNALIFIILTLGFIFLSGCGKQESEEVKEVKTYVENLVLDKAKDKFGDKYYELKHLKASPLKDNSEFTKYSVDGQFHIYSSKKLVKSAKIQKEQASRLVAFQFIREKSFNMQWPTVIGSWPLSATRCT